LSDGITQRAPEDAADVADRDWGKVEVIEEALDIGWREPADRYTSQRRLEVDEND
jgi:hypothetical protein